MRFPNAKDGLGAAGFKFENSTNYYALIVKKKFKLDTDVL